MSKYVYINSIRPQDVYPYTVPTFHSRIQEKKSRFRVVDDMYLRKELPRWKYFCNYQDYLPPIDRFVTHLKPNCVYMATGETVCFKKNTDCFVRN
jgi:hypothetical protein